MAPKVIQAKAAGPHWAYEPPYRLTPAKPKKRSGKALKDNLVEVGGQRNVLITNAPPIMRAVNSGRTELIVEKTECLATLITTGAAGAANFQQFPFHSGSLDLNWLRNMSNSFAEWQLLAAEFTYVPSVPTTQAGTIVVAINGDYTDTTPAAIAELQRYDGAVTGPVYAGTDGGLRVNSWGLNHPNTVGVVAQRYMFQYGNAPRTYRVVSATTFGALGTQDQNNYSPFELIVATSGTGLASTSIGSMFVRYKVRLLGCTPISLQ